MYRIYLKTGQVIECETTSEMEFTSQTLGDQIRSMEMLTVDDKWVVIYMNTGY